ncbi:MAG: peptide ABC transporter substrate-binding protein [Steroidobacteraceae bacterium]
MRTAAAATRGDETLRRARPGNLTTLDPQRPLSAADMEIAADLFTGLTAVDARGAIVPGCAERWQVSADGLRYEFQLRPGLRWSDGTPLTAADFVASYRRLLAPATAALLAYRYDALRGARELRAGRAAPDTLGISAPDERRVVIELERPETDLLKLAAVAYVTPAHAIARLGRDWAKPPVIVVNGAYRPESWAQNGTLAAVRNEHAGGVPATAPARLEWVMGLDDPTRLRLFRAGELHVAQIAEGSQLALARRELAAQLHSVPFYGGGWVGLNLRRPALRDARLRRALALAVDREVLALKVRQLAELPSESLVPEAVADYPHHAQPEHAAWPMARRLALARELAAAAGASPRQPRPLLAIFSANPLTERTFLALAAMWSPLGVRIEARGLESRAYSLALAQGEFDLMDYGVFSAVQSAASFIGRFRSGMFLNYSGYADPGVDRALDAAERQVDPLQRARWYLEAEQQLLRDYPAIPLYSGVAHRLVSSRVRGWAANPGLALPSQYLAFG